MKICFKCGLSKPLDDFYRHRMMADGYLNKCKVCAKKDVNENRCKRRDYYIAFDKKRSTTEKRKATHKKVQDQWRSKHPERRKASTTVSNAIKSGKLVREPCFICGETKVDGHHPDYSSPLSVVWLCRIHHRQLHAEHIDNTTRGR